MRLLIKRQERQGTLDFSGGLPPPPLEGGGGGYSYTNPLYRLDVELRKRGAERHEGYTTADAHYDRRQTEISYAEGPAAKMSTTFDWVQSFWLFLGRHVEGSNLTNIEATPCWNPVPGSSTCARPQPSVDAAVDQILAWADER